LFQKHVFIFLKPGRTLSGINESGIGQELDFSAKMPAPPALNGSVSNTTQQPAEDCIRRSLASGEYREAFDRLEELYSSKIFHLAFSMLRNETQAEDITQDVLLRVWKALPGYHGGASLSTWIYTITRNTCFTELKKRAARPTVSLQEPGLEGALDNLPALQSSGPSAGLTMDVNELLNQLPEKYQQVITLFYFEAKSYEEVGALLGLPLGTVKTLLYRGKKELLKLSGRPSWAAVSEFK
jgi:RNA polymerase sigma-70 factor (ECF subfamily)